MRSACITTLIQRRLCNCSLRFRDEARGVLYAAGKDKVVDMYALG